MRTLAWLECLALLLCVAGARFQVWALVWWGLVPAVLGALVLALALDDA